MKLVKVASSVIRGFNQITGANTPRVDLVNNIPSWATKSRFYNTPFVDKKSGDIITATDMELLKTEIKRELEVRKSVWDDKKFVTGEKYTFKNDYLVSEGVVNSLPLLPGELSSAANLNSLIELCSIVEKSTRGDDDKTMMFNPSEDSGLELTMGDDAVIGELITPTKYNFMSSKVKWISEACICNCNFCACHCNYCSCQCNYNCTCQCNYFCTCNCNYEGCRVHGPEAQKCHAHTEFVPVPYNPKKPGS